MDKSQLQYAARPNWYLNQKTRPQGSYFGSLSSLYPNEVFVTFDKKWIVTRSEGGEVSVVQNVCLHAGMEILNHAGTQHKSEIRCSGHQALFDMRGKFLAMPKFCKLEGHLVRPRYSVWNGFVLGYSTEELGALEGFGVSLGLPEGFLSADQFWFGKEKGYPMPYKRPIMGINYLDGLHIPVAHPTSFEPMIQGKYEWEFGPTDTSCSYSIQLVRMRQNLRAHVDRLMRTHKIQQSELGWADFYFWLNEVMPDARTPIDKDIFAVWPLIYGDGYVMPELYVGGRFLALSYLVSIDGTDNVYRTVSHVDKEGNPQVRTEHNLFNYVEFYVHKSVPEKYRAEGLEKFIFAYEQSAREDDGMGTKLEAAHSRSDIAFSRFVHETLEKGDAHFREWFLRHFVE